MQRQVVSHPPAVVLMHFAAATATGCRVVVKL